MTYLVKLAKGLKFGLGIGGCPPKNEASIEFMLFSDAIVFHMEYTNPCSCTKKEWIAFRDVVAEGDLTKSKCLKFSDGMSIRCEEGFILFMSTESDYRGTRMKIIRENHGMKVVELLNTIIDDESMNAKWELGG